MAKRIVDEEMKFDIIINGNEAQKELYDLEKSTRKLNEENKALGLQKKLLEKQNKQESAEYKNLTQTIRENNKEIRENKTRMGELQQQIGLNGLTMAQLTNKASQLKLTLRNLVPGSADYERYSADLKQVTTRINELSGKAQATKLSIGSIADGFNRYAALGATVIGTLTGVVLSIQKVIDFNGKLADAQTNVRKTTGLTKEQVDELSKSFGLLQTRTSRIDLLGIAEVGGRLGIAKEEIGDFVKVMDKSAVALGDSFEGGPEVVAEKLGRIKGLYEELKNAGVESAFESVGSALNDLGASGTASEQNMAEFVTRVGAMPAAFKPSIQEALGLGAAFEESGLKAEVAAGNYSKVISIASRDIDAFSTVMKRPKQELENLINSNPTEFFLQFASSLKGLDATQLAKVLDYLKLNDNEVKMVLGAASENVDVFREKMKLAGVSMAEATSLTAEYDLKNKNLAATIERVKKTVTGWFTSDSVVAWLTAAINGFAKLIGAVDDADGSATKWRNTLVFLVKAIMVVVAAMITSTGWMKLTALWTTRNTEATLLYNLAQKARAFADGVAVVATQAWAAANMLLRGNIVGATQALRVMATTMLTTPWGLVLGLIAAVGTAYVMYADSADKASRSQKIMNDVANAASNEVRQQKDELEKYAKVAKDTSLTEDVRLKALKDMIALAPEHLKNLTLENINTAEGNKLLDEYVKHLDKVARAKAVAAKLSQLYSEMLDVENSDLQDNIGVMEQFWNTVKGGGIVNPAKTALLNANTAIGNKEGAKKEIKESIDKLLEEQAADYKGGLKVTTTVEAGSVFVPDGDGDKARDKAAKEAADAHKKRMDDLAKQIEELRELKRKGIDDELSLMKDGFEKELAIENEQHARKLEDLKRQMISETALAGADAKINDPKSSKRDVDFWTQQKQVWVDKNAHLNTIIRHEESLHYNKIGVIVEKEYAKEIKKLDEQYKREKVKRETNYLGYLNGLTSFEEAKAALQGILSQDELDKIKTIEQAKAALQEDFNKQELARELKHIEESIGKMEQQLTPLMLFGTQINLLTPEQRDKILQDIEFMQNAAEKLKASMSAKGKNGTGDKSAEERDNEMKGVFNNLNGGADILGFTPEQWQQTYDNLDTLHGKMTAGAMVVGALQNLWGQYDTYMTASENNRLKQYEKGADSRKRKLKWELDNGYISQLQYKKGVEKLEQDVERQKAEIEYKQAKRKKAMSIVETIMNTSIAIMQAFSQLGPIGGAIAAVLIGTMGALQLKTIMEQPLPARGYEKGLYPEYVKREQDGKIFKSQFGGKTRSGMVNRPTHFLTGENGPEMIIDSKAYRDLSPETRNALERELKGIKGFENGLYNDNLKRFETPQDNGGPAAAAVPAGGITLEVALGVISRNTEIMEKIYNEGIVAYNSRDPRDIKRNIEDMKRIQDSRDKAKV